MNTPQFMHIQFMEDISLCDRVIEYFRANPELWEVGATMSRSTGQGYSWSTGEEGKQSTDLVCYGDNENEDIIEAVRQLQIALDDYIELYPYINEGAPFGLEPFNIQRYGPGEGFLTWHCERSMACEPINNRHITFQVNLNDVEVGGETEFFHQEFKSKAEKGKITFFPSDWTFTHRGLVTQEEKLILTGWYNYLYEY